MRPGRIELREAGSGVQVVALVGEHDLGTAEELRATFNRAFDKDLGVIIDLADTEFVDSSIVAVLVECGNIDQPDRCVAMYVPDSTSASVQRVLELTGLSSHLTVTPSMDDALRAAERQLS